MDRHRTPFVLLLLVVSLISCSRCRNGERTTRDSGTSTVSVDDRDRYPGRDVYLTHCQRCHGKDGRGSETPGTSFAVRNGPLALPDRILTAVVRDGKQSATGFMPPFGGTLDDNEISLVLGYIRHRFTRDIPPETALGSSNASPDAGTTRQDIIGQ